MEKAIEQMNRLADGIADDKLRDAAREAVQQFEAKAKARQAQTPARENEGGYPAHRVKADAAEAMIGMLTTVENEMETATEITDYAQLAETARILLDAMSTAWLFDD